MLVVTAGGMRETVLAREHTMLNGGKCDDWSESD